MKKMLFLLMALGLAIPALKAQDVAPLTYSEVIQVDGVSKDELYNRAKQWFVATYGDATKVIQNEDKESGIITGKAISGTMFLGFFYTKKSGGFGRKTDEPMYGTARYTITIAVKDGRYKYSVSDIYHEKWGLLPESFDNLDIPDAIKDTYGKAADRNGLKESADAIFEKLISSLKTGMSKPVPTEEDW